MFAQESNSALISVEERRAGIFHIGEPVSRYESFLEERSPSVYAALDGTMMLKSDCRSRISEIDIVGKDFFTERFVSNELSTLRNVLISYGEPEQVTFADQLPKLVLKYAGVRFRFDMKNLDLDDVSQGILEERLSGITITALPTEGTIESEDSLAGTWTGEGEHDTGGRLTIQMAINQDWNSQSSCNIVGRIDYPSKKCGAVMYWSEGRFLEELTYGNNRCIDGGSIQLMIDPHGEELLWKWYYPDGQWGARASLRKRSMLQIQPRELTN